METPRYFYHPDLSIWLSVDPLSDKYPNLTPYAYCANNPVNVIDPNGMDTVNIMYSTTNNKWEIGNPILAKEDDVYNVTNADGNTTTYTFTEGAYNNRMNVILLEDNLDLDESFGIFHLSGTTETGFVLQPSSTPKEGDHSNKPGEYNSYVGEGERWTNYIGLSGNETPDGIRIHYGKGRSWSHGCMIISSEYSSNGNGKKSFNLSKSQEAVWSLAQYAGATKRESIQMGTSTVNGRTIPRMRDYYTYGTFSAPSITIKK